MFKRISAKALRLFVRWEDQEGQALAEYGLIMGLIAVVALAALTALGIAVTDKINTVANAIP
jgi:pilus assembly protein Flp/PilA